MTQIRGIYCSYCRRRYARFMFKSGSPCEHHFGRVVEARGDYPPGMVAPATFIDLFSWRYALGYQHFDMQEIYFISNNGELTERRSVAKHFEAAYISTDLLAEKFFKFLNSEIDMFQWGTWVDAFVSLVLGGLSSTMIPNWRIRQLTRLRSEGGK